MAEEKIPWRKGHGLICIRGRFGVIWVRAVCRVLGSRCLPHIVARVGVGQLVVIVGSRM